MPKSCCVKVCTNNIKKNPGYSYYAIPSSRNRRKLWLAVIGRAVAVDSGNVCKNKLWSPISVHHYVCSKHFISGKRETYDKHPDYVPSLFLVNEKKGQSLHGFYGKLERNKRRLKRLKEASVLKVKRKLKVESVTEEAASTSTTMFHSSDEEQLLSNSSVIPHTLSHKQLNLPISDLSSSQELQSPSSLSLPALREFSSPTSTVILRTPQSVSERESIYEELDALRKERDRLLEENRILSDKSSGCFNANVIKECPEKCKMLVGISFPVLKKLFKYLCSDVKVSGTRPPLATIEDQIIITLLKLNVSFDMLRYMNNIGQSTAADYFWK